jgi:hypothetical protein
MGTPHPGGVEGMDAPLRWNGGDRRRCPDGSGYRAAIDTSASARVRRFNRAAAQIVTRGRFRRQDLRSIGRGWVSRRGIREQRGSGVHYLNLPLDRSRAVRSAARSARAAIRGALRTRVTGRSGELVGSRTQVWFPPDRDLHSTLANLPGRPGLHVRRTLVAAIAAACGPFPYRITGLRLMRSGSVILTLELLDPAPLWIRSMAALRLPRARLPRIAHVTIARVLRADRPGLAAVWRAVRAVDDVLPAGLVLARAICCRRRWKGRVRDIRRDLRGTAVLAR